MYTQLLAAAWQADVDGPAPDNASSGDLLGRLLGLRPLIEAGGGPANTDQDGHPGKGGDLVANQLSYDVTLMALAATVGIDAGPDRFAEPVAERRRLERALGEAGVDVAEMASQRADCPDAREPGIGRGPT